MAGGTAEVHQPAFGQHEDRCGRVVERVAIDRADVLGLMLTFLALPAFTCAFEPGHVDLEIEVADVADDRVVLHLLHVLAGG